MLLDPNHRPEQEPQEGMSRRPFILDWSPGVKGAWKSYLAATYSACAHNPGPEKLSLFKIDAVYNCKSSQAGRGNSCL
jgi:hypothetical protein